MKKKVFIILLIAVVVLIGFSVLSFYTRLDNISRSQIERIAIGTYHQERSHEWTEDEIAQFVKLYNAALYGGPADGSGCTPNYEVTIYYKDGSSMQLSEFCGIKADFEVTIRNVAGVRSPAHYIKSAELRAFLDELYDSTQSK